MLQVFRESIGRYVAIAILALIAVTFIFFGIDFSITQTSFAAKVDGEPIPIREFERQLQQQQQQIQQQARIELTDDMRREIRRSLIDEMVMREVLSQRTRKAGYRISDARLLQAVRSDPTFQINGSFSQDVYVSLLAQVGLTPTGWEAEQRDVLRLVDWQNGLRDSSFVTPAEFRRSIELYDERRRVAYALFAAADYLAEVEIGDDAVAAYYEENTDRFMTEESVDIEYIVFDLADVAAGVEISEQQLRDYYQSEIENYAAGEERRVSHILIEPEGDDHAAAEARAEAVKARLDAGEDFAAVAAEVSDDAGTRNVGGDLGWQTRGGLLEGPFEDALYSMNVGEIAGPVETQFGFHVLRLDEVRAAEPEPFEAVRDELLEERKREEAYSTFYSRAYDLENDAYDARDDLASVAESYGLELRTLDGLTRAGGADRFADPAPIVAAAFDDEAIASGENSSLIELADDRVAILRVRAHHLPEAKPLEAVAGGIRASLEQDAAADLAEAAASAYFEALEAETGDQLAGAAALAEERGAAWNPSRWIERDSADLPPTIVSLVFAQQKPGDETPRLLRAGVGGGDQAIVLFTGVESGLPEDVVVAEREQRQQALSDSAAASEINAYAADARAKASVRVPDEILNPQL